MKYCTKCGAPLAPSDKFCTKCGNKIEQINVQPIPYEKSSVDKKLKPWHIALIAGGGVILAIIIVVIVAASSCGKQKSSSSISTTVATTVAPTTTKAPTMKAETTTQATTAETTQEEKKYYISGTLNGQDYYSIQGTQLTSIDKVEISGGKFIVRGCFMVAEDDEDFWYNKPAIQTKTEYSFNITSDTEFFSYDLDENKNYYSQDEFIKICKSFNGLGLILRVKGNTLIEARLAS